MTRLFAALVVIAPLLAVGSGCAKAPPPSNVVPPGAPFSRAICFSPNFAEIAFAIGAGDSVIGVTEWTHHPPEATTRPRIGSLYGADLERITRLRPDLVISQAALARDNARFAELGLPVLSVRNETLDDMRAGIPLVGRALGREKEAAALLAKIEAKLAEIAKRLDGAPRPRALVVIERAPGTVRDLTAAARGNFVHELLNLAGATNVLADVAGNYPKVTQEEIVARDPEVILDFSVHAYGGKPLDDDEARRPWRDLGTIAAVRANRIVVFPEGFDLTPGPRTPEILEAFARAVHPERFP